MKKSIAIIGGGAAGMAAASFIDTSKYEVSIYEKNKALGRKFLVAGKGGFNLTHSIKQEEFKKLYTPLGFLDHALDSFTSKDLRHWLSQLNIPTYVGSSGRIFPVKGIKPIEVLDAILKHIQQNDVRIKSNYTWDGQELADIHIYALGGASWEVTGSDGKWSKHFETTRPFAASNCAFQVKWPEVFIKNNSGKPLKNISLKLNDHSVKGEVVVTDFGLEGNAIYAHSMRIQHDLKSQGFSTIHIDLKTHLTKDVVLNKLQFSKEKTVSNSLKRDIKLDKTCIQLLQNVLTKEEYLDPEVLAKMIKALPIKLVSAAPISDAISTTGGINIETLDDNFQIKNQPGHFCIGEMIDWNAPTGGFLLQACFSMGHYLAIKLNE